MCWMETIHVRTNEIPREQVVKELLSQRAALRDEELLTMQIFLHSVIDTDLCIHLTWKDAPLAPSGSSIGQRLVAGLRMVCQAKHTVWRQFPTQENSA
jgi:hypothetical protein